MSGICSSGFHLARVCVCVYALNFRGTKEEITHVQIACDTCSLERYLFPKTILTHNISPVLDLWILLSWNNGLYHTCVENQPFLLLNDH